MEKVLMVAYQFPPVGGSGVQRSAKFAKYLPQYGWQPVVLTRDTGKMTLRDESLLKEVDPSWEILRTPARDLTVFPGIFAKPGKFIAWKLLVPDGEVLWKQGAVKAALKRLEKGDIKAVYTTSYPYSDHLIGLAIKKAYPNIPWIADFRDEWTNNPYLLDKPHPAWRMKKEKAMEKKVLAAADKLITNTPVMKDNFVRLNPGMNLETRMAVIPNGFDRDDFKALDDNHAGNKQFTITYTGAFYERRKPDLFLEAVGNLVKSKQLVAGTIKIRFIGSYKKETLAAWVRANGLEASVELMGYMNHDQCLQKMAESDAMLLIEGGGPGSEAFYTGKLFEYIQTGSPIFAVIPAQGAAARLIRQTGTGVVCHWNDVRAIEKGFLELYNAWLTGEALTRPNHDEIAKFDRKVLTANLAEILDAQNLT